MRAAIRRVGNSLSWRMRRLLRAAYSAHEVAFWVGDAEDAPWYPDLEKVAEIRRSVGMDVKVASPDDLDLFRDYHGRDGGTLGRGRVREMRRRWSNGDRCYIALDGDGRIAAYMWAARGEVRVDAIGDVYRPGPTEIVHYDVVTRPDRRGSMGFVACGCASLEAMFPHGYRRVTSFGEPHFFEAFRKLHWFTGLGKMKPLRLVRCTRLLGFCSRQATELDEDWSPSDAGS